MKHFSKLAFLLTLGLALGSCDKFVDDLSVDPNNPSNVDATNTLQGVIVADALVHEAEAARLSGIWTAQFTGSIAQYIPLNNYNVTSGNFDDIWDTSYYGVVAQARITAANAEAAGVFRLQGVAQILEAHMIGTLTSLFGDIPYREAVDRAQFPQPAFDPQPQIYDDLQKALDVAIANLGKSGGIPAAQDIFFAGSAPKWAGVANTLKARYYLQTKNYAAARTAAQSGISSPANSMIMPHLDASGGQNVYFQFTVNERGGYLTATNSYAAQLLDPARAGMANNRNTAATDESARFDYYFTAAPTGTTNYGLQEGEGFSAPDASFPLVTYVENQLIIAEASAILNSSGDNATALTALNNVRAALQAQYAGSTYAPYTLATLPGTGTDNAKLLREIRTERYLTFIGQIGAFNDARRTNNALGLPLKTSGAPSLPQRFLYPQSEINTNRNQVPSPLPGLFDQTPVNK
ncbi:SusD/RagB family nutrient-binding outer membrane lipoprotein [Hymenobacter terrestris]|uniref:SusD/RagB family nutrient-binding outer membrane lipoprotein n=1 Tax=Hymenobacter terrestris TaxID=2748310 RepID=A0ABX2Q3G3_9BACT|nr:SusD/RagB family nutrient-binding outer membrane lipoprotein [Hymenobacter terrestris]NVO85089.1 SusD/RagB family nutrient-binding outer membrane lipoprotein [Hymenobacter terrestris]